MTRFRCAILVLAVATAGGCSLLRTRGLSPRQAELVRDQLVIHSDFDLPRRHRLVDELVAKRADIAELLTLPMSDEPIHIYLFETADRYHSFIERNYPEFPVRRAFFVESDTQLNVYAHWGDRVAEDLRHEVAHGYLHAALPDIPLVLDEGLAEFFEVARGRNGLHTGHIDLLLSEHERGLWSPDLRRLETLVDVADMSQRDYAEAWAWVHLLLTTTEPRRELLRGYLARLRMTRTAPPLSEAVHELEVGAETQLIQHLQSLRDAAHR